MDDSGERKPALFVVILLVIAVAGAWWFFQRPATVEAIDETLDVFVPDAEEMERRMDYIDQARQLVDTINSR